MPNATTMNDYMEPLCECPFCADDKLEVLDQRDSGRAVASATGPRAERGTLELSLKRLNALSDAIGFERRKVALAFSGDCGEHLPHRPRCDCLSDR